MGTTTSLAESCHRCAFAQDFAEKHCDCFGPDYQWDSQSPIGSPLVSLLHYAQDS